MSLLRGVLRVFRDKASLVEKKTRKEKHKSTRAKKPPQSPRPPKELSLDAADQKLIKAMIKRGRFERMKMKAAKASSTSLVLNDSSIALLFTILFFFVLLFQ
ncbi:hypothetical protein HAX54_033637, partial [Datura stramonium]|nr:hypothetical protein [Datura stramonium]